MADTDLATESSTSQPPSAPSSRARESRTAIPPSPNGAPQDLTAGHRETRDPLDDLVARLDEIRPHIQDQNPRLSATVERLVAPADHPDYVSRLHYPSHAAQALQDTERLVGRIDTDPALREELSRLAISTPGLGNERLQKLLELTPSLADQGLVNKIRETAAEVAKLTDQKSQAVENRINALGFDVAIAPRRDPQSIQSAYDDRPTPAVALALIENALSLRRDPEGSPSVREPAEPARETVDPTRRSRGAAPSDDDAHAKANNEMAAFGPDPRRAEHPAQTQTSTASADQHLPSTKQLDAEPPVGARSELANAAPPPRQSDQPKQDGEKPDQAAAIDSEKRGPVGFSGAAGAAASIIAGVANATKGPDNHTTAVPKPADSKASAGPEYDTEPQSPQSNTKPKPAQNETNSGKLDPFRPSTPGGLFSNLFAAITPSGQERARSATNAQTPRDLRGSEPQQANMKLRSTAFEAKQQGRRDASAIEAAERAGQAALDALKALENGPAQRVLQRIQSAAENTPGGIEKVLEGMQDGGPFSDLRKAFKGALAANEGLQAAFEKAEGALANYAEHRNKITPLIASHQDAHALSKKFEELDRNIGEAAWTIPGTEDGKRMFQKLSDGAGQVFEKLAGALRGALGAQASAAASARPSPGP